MQIIIVSPLLDSKNVSGVSSVTRFSSHLRNKNIANAFFKAGFNESWGRGYEKIRKGFEDVGLTYA